jgi:hypothetical protein
VLLRSIWLPDVTVYNNRQGLMHSLDPAMAIVHSDGTVQWSRPGMLDLMCRFSGLVKFPFDTLSCPIEVGGWQTSGSTQGLQPLPEGCAEEGKAYEEVAMSSYTEYLIESVACETALHTYAHMRGEAFPVIKYRVRLKRSSQYYVGRLRVHRSLHEPVLLPTQPLMARARHRR